MVGPGSGRPSRVRGETRGARRLCRGATMTDDPDHRFDLIQTAPMPEVSPTQGIRVFDRLGREIVVLPPDPRLYAYLVARLSSELQRMMARGHSDT